MAELIDQKTKEQHAFEASNSSPAVTDRLPGPATEPGAMVTNQNIPTSPAEPAKPSAPVTRGPMTATSKRNQPMAPVSPPAGTDSLSGSEANISPEPESNPPTTTPPAPPAMPELLANGSKGLDSGVANGGTHEGETPSKYKEAVRALISPLEIHEIANYLPDMTEEEFQGLKDDIAGLGVLEPIILLDGKILDGRHRYRACQELGIECPTKTITDASPNDIVAALNIHRRHLNASQRAMVMTQLREPYAKEATSRQQASLPQKGQKGFQSNEGPIPVPHSGDVINPASPGKAATHLAKKGGIGRGTMIDALTVADQGTAEQRKSVINGQASACKIAKEIRDKKKVAAEQAKPRMNLTNENIGWAQYSWNPVTGCKFGCDYCYAKAIHNLHFSDTEFEDPKFHEDRLDMPANTKPRAGDNNNRVFTCSMGELFGDWVPQDWIDQVISVARCTPQWTFLFLTKNPKRLPSIDFPENTWIGATIDRQSRVDATEQAFAMMAGKKLFISCEPLLEPVELSEKLLSILKLIIIGAKSTGATKEQPDYRWVERLLFDARSHGVKVWFKDNLEFRPQESIADHPECVQEPEDRTKSIQP